MNKTVFIIFFKSKSIEVKVQKSRCLAPGATRAGSNGMAGGDRRRHRSQSPRDPGVRAAKNRAVRHRLCAELSGLTNNWLGRRFAKKPYHTPNMLRPDVSGMLRGEGQVATSVDEVRGIVERTHA